ncbi:zinc-binding dehydrogenase [Actinoplanes sp. NPDC051470]|uniref:zinc-dependent alcohol dehydrogenase n=1 Tax=unclassified Actinoplanes TaxID=2626549 RepID=UPI003439B175
MKQQALEYHRSPGRYFAGRMATGTRLGGRLSGTVAAKVAPLKHVQRPDPVLPGAGWTRVRPLLSGICGSDLGLLTGRNSPYLSPLISTPFVPGHEVVGETLDDLDGLPKGTRVVLDPVLGCVPRGLEPCPNCAMGQHSRCDNITTGKLTPGIQTGFCEDTGGGWSRQLVAHRTQLHAVPDGLSDEIAVLVEPLACAIHAVKRADVPSDSTVLVIGAGTVGLLTVLALRAFTKAGPIMVIARHPRQRDRARELGATEVIGSDRALRALRRKTGGFVLKPELGEEFLLGGADVAFDCTSGSGLTTATRAVKAGGTVVMAGMPNENADLTPVWLRELSIVGGYASGGEDFPDAIGLAQDAPLAGYVDAVYSLRRWTEAVQHATSAGRLGSTKVVFNPRLD